MKSKRIIVGILIALTVIGIIGISIYFVCGDESVTNIFTRAGESIGRDASDLGEARIGSQYYGTLEQAISAATSGQTVTLNQTVDRGYWAYDEDYESSNTTQIVIPRGKNITLDLNGYTLQGVSGYRNPNILGDDDFILNYGNLTITSSKGTGYINSLDLYGAIMNYGRLTVKDNVSIVGNEEGLDVGFDSYTTIDGGYIRARGGTGIVAQDINNGNYEIAHLVINRGTIEGSTGIDSWDYSAINFVIEFNGGEVKGKYTDSVIKETEYITVLTPPGYAVSTIYTNGYYVAKLAESAEAKINSTNYSTIEEAVSNATNTQTVTLLRNIVRNNLCIEIPSNKNITLDLNGYTISSEEAGSDSCIENAGTLIVTSSNDTGNIKITGINCAISNTGTLTIKSGVNLCGAEQGISTLGGKVTIDGGYITSDIYEGIATYDGGAIIINGGTIGCGTYPYGNAAIYTNGSKASYIEINGGEIIGDTEGISCFADTAIQFNGGEVKGKNEAIHCDSSYGGLEIVAKPGYAVNTTYTNGVYVAKLAESPEAKINSKNYTTIEDAITAATSGQTITLLRNLDRGYAAYKADGNYKYSQIVIPSGKNIILDLNGYTLGGISYDDSNNQEKRFIENHGTLTIKSSNVTGYIISEGLDAPIRNHNTLTIMQDVELEGVENGLEIEGGTTTIQGGTIIGNDNGSSGISITEAGSLIVNGGYIYGYDGIYIADGSAAQININGGIIEGRNKNGYGICVASSIVRVVKFNGGEIKGVSGSVNNNITLTPKSGYVVKTTSPEENRTEYYIATLIKQYTITFNGNSGSVVGSQNKTVLEGETYGDLPSAERTGYTFTGWYTDSTNGAKIESNTTVSLSGDQTSNQTLYAHWTPKQYTVTFDVNRGTDLLQKTAQVTYDAEYGSLPQPSRTGYNFAGWWTESANGTRITENTKVTRAESHTLYAHWTAKILTITLDAQGGNIPTEQNKLEVTYDKNYPDLPIPTKTGYTFDGWWTTSSGGTQIQKGNPVKIDTDITAYAHWIINRSSLKVDPAGGNVTITPKGESQRTISDATTYTQDYNTTLQYGTPTKTSTQATTTYTVTYKGNGASDPTSATATKTDTTNYTFIKWTKTGTFYGRLSNESGSGTYTYSENKDVTSTITATYTSSVTSSTTEVTLPTITRTGYTFDGWYDRETGGTKKGDAEQKITPDASITLYAHWTINTSSLTIDPAGGTVTVDPAGKVQETIENSTTYTQDYNTTLQYGVPTKEQATETTTYTVQFNGNGVANPNNDTATKTDTTNYTFNKWTKSEPFYGNLSNESRSGTYTYSENNNVTSTITATYTSTLSSNTTQITLPTLTKTGYTFDGWYDAQTEGTRKGGAGESFTPTESTTLYAHWTPKTITLTFDVNEGDGTVPNSVTATYDSIYQNLPKSTRTGYTFNGWWTSPTGGNEIIEGSTVDIAVDTKLYAHWTAQKYTVTLDSNGGTDLETKTVTVTYDEKYPEFETPKRTGYDFDGWYTGQNDGDKITTDTDVKITGPQRLYAHWIAQTYTVTLDANNGEVNPGSIKATYKSTYQGLVDATRAGYTFDGWYTSNNEDGEKIQNGDTVEITQNTTLYAHWIANKNTKYTVETYKMNIDGTYGDAIVEERQGETDTEVSIEVHTEEGFSLDDSQENNLNGTIAGNESTVLKIYYKRNKYLLTLVKGTGIDTVTGENEYYYEASAKIDAEVKKGYQWNNWTGDNISQISEKSHTLEMPAKAIVLTANANIITYEITYNLDGGKLPEGQEENPKTYNVETEEFTLPTPTKTGYNFIGWTEDNIQSEPQKTVKIPTGTTENKTFTAHWKAQTYTLTFDVNGGNADVSDEIIVTYNEEYPALPNAEKTGYTFNGWWTLLTEGNEIVTGNTVEITQSTKLYAHWIPNQYTVTLDAQGGNIPEGNNEIQVTYDGKYENLPSAERTGYTFDGWWTLQTGGYQVTTQTVVNITDEQTLYAHWTPKTFTVELDANGGQVDETEIQVTYDTKYGELPTPTRDGYGFNGWWTSKDDNGKRIHNEDTVDITNNTKFFAHWIADTNTKYTVETYEMNTEGTYEKISTEEKHGETDTSVSIEANPREGFELDNDQDNNLQATIAGNGSTVLKVYYKRNKYDLNLVAGTGISSVTGADEYYFETIAEINAQVKPGYEWENWTSSEIDTITEKTHTIKMPAKAVSLTANASIITYNITYELEGGSLSEGQENLRTYTVEKEDFTLIAPTRTGYDFEGWTEKGQETEPQKNVTINKGTTGDKTYTAHWKAKTFTVTLDANGGQLPTTENSIQVTYDSTYKGLPTPTKEGYRFAGWWTEEEQITEESRVEILEPTTLHAKWDKIYTLTFEKEDGSTETREAVENDVYPELPSLEKEGYEFLGWFTDEEGGDQIREGDPVDIEQDTNLYPHWKAKEFTLTFDAKEGQLPPETSNQMTVTYDTTYVGLPTPTREGYNFEGWFTEEVQISDGQTVKITKDTIVYAHWKDIEAPDISKVEVNATSDSITVEVTANDSGSGIKEYIIILKKDGEEENTYRGAESSTTFENLEEDSIYEIEVKVVDKANNESVASEEVMHDVKDIYTLPEAPTLTRTSDGMLPLSETNVEENEFEGINAEEMLELYLQGEHKNTYKVDDGGWTDTEDNIVYIPRTSGEHTITVKAKEGEITKKESEERTYTIRIVEDKTAPIITQIDEVKIKDVSIKINVHAEDVSKITTIYARINNGDWKEIRLDNPAKKVEQEVEFTDLFPQTEYTIDVQAKDELENRSDSKTKEITTKEEIILTLTVHHYIEGTTTPVPLKNGNVAEDDVYTGKEGQPYRTHAIDSVSLQDKYELSKTPENAEGEYGEENIELTYEYKVKEYKVTARVGSHKEQTDNGEEDVLGGRIEGEQEETVQYGETSKGVLKAVPDEGYRVKSIKVNGEPQEFTPDSDKSVVIDPITNITKNTEIVVEFERIPAKVIVHHMIYEDETQGKTNVKLIEDEEIEGTVGKAYSTSKSNRVRLDYECMEEMTEGLTEGKMTEDTIEVTYYYRLKTPTMNTNITNESNMEVIETEGEKITYRIVYNINVENYVGKVKVQIIDKLPEKISTTGSELNGGIYNSEEKTITWEQDIEVNGTYNTPITKEIKLVYESENVNSVLENKVEGKAIIYYPDIHPVHTGESRQTSADTASTNTRQEYKVSRKVNVVWKDNENVKERRPGSVTACLTVDGTENGQTIVLNDSNNWTYTFANLAKYTNEGREIEYSIKQKETNSGDLEYYEAPIYEGTDNIVITNRYKLMETDLNTRINQTGPNSIVSSKETQNYTITYTGDITNYIGAGKISIVEYLPYEINEAKSSIAEGRYNRDAKTITWEENIEHINTYTEGIKHIEITRAIKVVYSNIDANQDSMKVKAKGTIELYETEEQDTKEESITTNINIQGRVIVKYEDKDTKEEIYERIEKRGKVGAEYSTEKKDIYGYAYENTEGVVNGRFTEEDIEVIYYYKQIPSGGVHIRYIDENGNDIITSETIEGRLGKEYNIPEKEITGYDYVGVAGGALSGTMTEDTIEIVFTYKRVPGKVIVKYLEKIADEEAEEGYTTKQLLPDKEITGWSEESYKTERVEIKNYRPAEPEPTNAEGKMGRDEIIVIYYYEKIPSGVVRVYFIDDETNEEIKYKDKDTGEEKTYGYEMQSYVGEPYETKEKDVPYYNFVESKMPGNKEGEYTEEDKEVKYYYKKKEFNLVVDEEITRITVNGDNKPVHNNKLAKIEVIGKQIANTSVEVCYKITVTNTGEIKGKAKLVNKLPEYFKIAEAQEGWLVKDNGNLEREVELEAGESRVEEIVLEWRRGEDNFGSQTNIVELSEVENEAKFEEKVKKDNQAKVTVLMTIKTGNKVIIYILETALTLGGIGALIEYKRRKRATNTK